MRNDQCPFRWTGPPRLSRSRKWSSRESRGESARPTTRTGHPDSGSFRLMRWFFSGSAFRSFLSATHLGDAAKIDSWFLIPVFEHNQIRHQRLRQEARSGPGQVVKSGARLGPRPRSPPRRSAARQQQTTAVGPRKSGPKRTQRSRELSRRNSRGESDAFGAAGPRR
jgi:hypothetical protein